MSQSGTPAKSESTPAKSNLCVVRHPCKIVAAEASGWRAAAKSLTGSLRPHVVVGVLANILMAYGLWCAVRWCPALRALCGASDVNGQGHSP
eukprot:6618812-Prymnesium_polylepis.1